MELCSLRGPPGFVPDLPLIAACGLNCTLMGFTRRRSSQSSVGRSGAGEEGNHSGCPLQSGFSLLSLAALFSRRGVAEGLPPWGWLGVSPPVTKPGAVGFLLVSFCLLRVVSC